MSHSDEKLGHFEALTKEQYDALSSTNKLAYVSVMGAQFPSVNANLSEKSKVKCENADNTQKGCVARLIAHMKDRYKVSK
jgi:hypothetical protein